VSSMFFIYRLEKIRVGRAFAAIRDELAADAMGINPPTIRYWLSRWAILAGSCRCS